MHNKLYGVQALRAIAAAFVVLVHAVSTYAEKVGPVTPMGILLPGGEQGVLLFFAISGFIIHNSTVAVAQGWSSIGGFWKRRLIRIVPLYWLATIIYGVKLALTGAPPATGEWLKSLFFIPYGDFLMRPILGAGWTLNYEMLFYLIFSISLALPSAYRLGLIAVILAALRLGHETDLWTSLGLKELQMLSASFIDYFLLGMILSALRNRFAGFQVLRLSPAQACLWSVGIFTVGHVIGNHAGWSSHLFESAVTLCALFIALQETHSKELKSRTLRVVTAAGDASFSTYLFHGFVMGPVARLIFLSGLPISSIAFSFSMVVLCTAVGILIFRYLERPLLKRASRRPKAAGPGELATR